MSKIIFNDRQQVSGFHSVTHPTHPSGYSLPAAERRIADPSSCLPKGRCYPIPSFFEYRTKVRETEFR